MAVTQPVTALRLVNIYENCKKTILDNRIDNISLADSSVDSSYWRFLGLYSNQNHLHWLNATTSDR